LGKRISFIILKNFGTSLKGIGYAIFVIGRDKYPFKYKMYLFIMLFNAIYSLLILTFFSSFYYYCYILKELILAPFIPSNVGMY